VVYRRKKKSISGGSLLYGNSTGETIEEKAGKDQEKENLPIKHHTVSKVMKYQISENRNGKTLTPTIHTSSMKQRL
jgi:hypothetical protein